MKLCLSFIPNPDIETRIIVQSIGAYSKSKKYVVTSLVISYFLDLLDVLRGCARIVFSISGFGLIVLLSITAHAEDALSVNGYDIHYNAFPTLSIDKDAAKNYQIKRSKNRGMVNISVLKQQETGMPIAVEAQIIFMVKNFYGQDKNIEIRKISENDGAIYYISTFPITNGETIIFNAYVTPAGSDKQTHIKFSREFFTR